jgi:hypothetical protein
MMTMDRRYCCSSVLAEPHEDDCAVWASARPETRKAAELLDRWTPAERESALRFIAGLNPEIITRDVAKFLDEHPAYATTRGRVIPLDVTAP